MTNLSARSAALISQLKESAEIETIYHPSWIPIQGNAICSGDPVLDAEFEAELSRRAEWDPYAWFDAEVKATYRGVSASAFLGACSYASDLEFERDAYHAELVDEAIEGLADALCLVASGIEELEKATNRS